MRKRGAAVQRDVLNGQQKFPERLGHIRILAPRGKQKVNRENHKVRRHDPQDATRVESRQIQMLATRDLRQELAANQIAAENKKEIDADPTPSMDATRQRETHDASVINDDDDDCQRAEKIETGLALAALETRVDVTLLRCWRFGRHAEEMKQKLWRRNQSRWERRQTIESDSLFVVESFSKFSIQSEYD